MDVRERIVELARAVGIDVDAEHVSPDRCWVDHRVSCPYGTPEGQYILRPEGFCHEQTAQGDGCATYHRHVVDPELTGKQEVDAICSHFESEKTDLTGELYARADELPEGSPEQLALRLAADVLDAHKLNRDILLQEDLPR